MNLTEENQLREFIMTNSKTKNQKSPWRSEAVVSSVVRVSTSDHWNAYDRVSKEWVLE